MISVGNYVYIRSYDGPDYTVGIVEDIDSHSIAIVQWVDGLNTKIDIRCLVKI